MLDTTSLTTAVDRFADRLRAAPQSRLQRGAAAEALALARELSVRTQELEEPGSAPREMPDAGMFAAADQITVAARDLALVLTDPDELAEAVGLVAEAQQRAGV
ncbi:hypothetical protein DSC45_19450 [Streptomyces sp. YIM 130001]|uniref:hypothetical protein n=1 Tax=Streptomyces sp. YIM 130001 TaxID=2259644 RepID=UPI000E6545E1|nr:hypothetical protein [Streptomyces sp. YIM 130001]RII15073.1 hypothetical protein DSC45_19450 [Streptomyces sp. YIM 130001]